MHRSWVLLPFGPAADMDEVRHRIEVSFRLIRDALPRKVRAALPCHMDGQGPEAP
ncbi:hypothetical protein [Rhodobacter sp. CZR27]|uniref:hypothetical protein n=1 Tax=Rhodobacter sp. CZR27 TaxID=2033869 RepID=UPI002FC937DA